MKLYVLKSNEATERQKLNIITALQLKKNENNVNYWNNFAEWMFGSAGGR